MIELLALVVVWTAVSFFGVRSAFVPLVRNGQLNEQAMRRYTERLGLPPAYPVPPSVAARLVERDRSRRRGWLLGVSGGIIAAVVIRAVDGTGGVSAAIFMSSWAGVTIGDSLAVLRRTTVDDRRARIARLGDVRLADYTTKAAVVTFWLVPAVIAAALIAFAYIWVRAPDNRMTWVLPVAVGLGAVVALGCWALAGYTMSRIVHQPQRTADTAELVWDDALRADGILFLHVIAFVFGFMYGGLVGLAAMDTLNQSDFHSNLALAVHLGLTGLVVIGGSLILLLVLALSSLSKPVLALTQPRAQASA